MMSCWLFVLFQVVLDVLDPEDTVSCLLSLLHRVDLSAAEQWSVNFTRKIIILIILCRADVSFYVLLVPPVAT